MIGRRRAGLAAQRVVVIGAGVAGLVAGLRLAHAGLDVTIVERALQPGGKMRSVRVDDSLIEAGPTVFTMRWVFEEIFSECGAELGDRVALDYQATMHGTFINIHTASHSFAAPGDAEALEAAILAALSATR